MNKNHRRSCRKPLPKFTILSKEAATFTSIQQLEHRAVVFDVALEEGIRKTTYMSNVVFVTLSETDVSATFTFTITFAIYDTLVKRPP